VTLRDDYASELDYLYDHAGELARKYPEDAPLLGRDASPAVSRLLESAAFVFARLRQRLDDDLPEVIHPVIESILPSLLRPLPCATILELRPAPNMAAPLVVPPERRSRVARSMAARASSDRRRARMCAPGASRESSSKASGASCASASSSTRERSSTASLATARCALLRGPTPMALDARSALLRGTREILATDGAGRSVSLLPGTLAAVGPTLEETEHAEVVALRQYFARPAFFAFVDVPHIDRAATLAAERGRLDIVLRLAAPVARSIRLDLDTVRLHCVPALNVQRLNDRCRSRCGGEGAPLCCRALAPRSTPSGGAGRRA